MRRDSGSRHPDFEACGQRASRPAADPPPRTSSPVRSKPRGSVPALGSGSISGAANGHQLEIQGDPTILLPRTDFQSAFAPRPGCSVAKAGAAAFLASLLRVGEVELPRCRVWARGLRASTRRTTLTPDSRSHLTSTHALAAARDAGWGPWTMMSAWSMCPGCPVRRWTD